MRGCLSPMLFVKIEGTSTELWWWSGIRIIDRVVRVSVWSSHVFDLKSMNH